MTTTCPPGSPPRHRTRCEDGVPGTTRPQLPNSLPTPPLRDVLAAEGWTVAQLAARAGLHPKSVARALTRPALASTSPMPSRSPAAVTRARSGLSGSAGDNRRGHRGASNLIG